MIHQNHTHKMYSFIFHNENGEHHFLCYTSSFLNYLRRRKIPPPRKLIDTERKNKKCQNLMKKRIRETS